MQRDLKSRIVTNSSLKPDLYAATTNGSQADVAGFLSCAVVIHAGTITDGTHTLKLQESDTSGSGFADVAAGSLQGSFTALTSSTTAGTTQEVGYIGNKRYLRVVSTVTGTPSTGGQYAALIIAGRPTGAVAS